MSSLVPQVLTQAAENVTRTSESIRQRSLLAEDFSTLDVSRYRVRLRARKSALLPRYLGSTLRGGFGHALKEAVCVVRHRDCERCILAERCIYPYLFETSPPPSGLMQGQTRAPHPFILMPPLDDAGAVEAPRRFDRTQCGSSGQDLRLVK